MEVTYNREIKHKHDFKFSHNSYVCVNGHVVDTYVVYKCSVCGRLERKRQHNFFHLMD